MGCKGSRVQISALRGLCDGRRMRVLAIVDDHSRECLVLEVDTSITGKRVVAVLERLGDLRGLPLSITVDMALSSKAR